MGVRNGVKNDAVPEAGAPMSPRPCARSDTAEACPHS
jgi:hypothetical protein